jgi:hypothetical protein
LLIAYASRGLDSIQNASLEEHLTACAACREFVQNQRAAWQALDLWEPAPISADFDRRLEQRVAQEVSWGQRIWGDLARAFGPVLVHRAVPIAATAVLLVAAGVLLDRPAAPPLTPEHTAAAQMDALRPDQVVQALDEMDALNQFNHSLKADGAESRM